MQESWKQFEYIYLKDFGLIKLFNGETDIYIRTIPDYKKMDLSHAHDDVFSCQIIAKNSRVGEDLGSVVYTADKEMRNKLARNMYHNVPMHSKEILERRDVFDAKTVAVGNTVINDREIIISVQWEGILHTRKFVVEKNALKIYDYSNEKFQVNKVQDNFFSLGHGQLYRRGSNEHIRKIS